MERGVVGRVWRKASTRVFIAFLLVNLPLVALFYIGTTILISENLIAEFENTIRSNARLAGILVEREPTIENLDELLDDFTLSGELAYAAYVDDKLFVESLFLGNYSPPPPPCKMMASRLYCKL